MHRCARGRGRQATSEALLAPHPARRRQTRARLSDARARVVRDDGLRRRTPCDRRMSIERSKAHHPHEPRPRARGDVPCVPRPADQVHRRPYAARKTRLLRAVFGRGVLRLALSQRPHAAKCLTLGAIDVPKAYLVPLVRGLLDGDGSVCVFWNKPTRAKYPNYEYERLWVFFLSASRVHIDWLRARIKETFGLNGHVERIIRKKRHDLFRLKYGKRESIVLLPLLYSDPNAPSLDRKRRKWIDYALRNTNVCAGGGS